MQARELDSYLQRLTDMLRTHAEPRRAQAAQRDKATKFECLAIRVPVLREIATKRFALKELRAEERLEVHDYIWRRAAYYEALSVPLLYYRARKAKVERFEFDRIRHWIDRVDNWGHADDLGVTLSYYNEKFGGDVMPYLRALNRSGELWRIRVSIVAMLHYSGKNAVYLKPDTAFELIEPHLGDRRKYVANAVGWVLREYAKQHPDATATYVDARRERIAPTALRRMRS
jgi:3-methyladenine DNA glycosylase AlkD